MTLFTQDFRFYEGSTENTLVVKSDFKYPHKLTELYTDRYTLSTPIEYTSEYIDGSYIAIVDDLNLWGEDNTLLNAERSLAKELISVYEDLQSHQQKNLGPYPRKVLNFLQNHIQSETS